MFCQWKSRIYKCYVAPLIKPHDLTGGSRAEQPKVNTASCGLNTFTHRAAKLWNTLPSHKKKLIQSSISVSFISMAWIGMPLWLLRFIQYLWYLNGFILLILSESGKLHIWEGRKMKFGISTTNEFHWVATYSYHVFLKYCHLTPRNKMMHAKRPPFACHDPKTILITMGTCMMTSSNGNIFRVTVHLCGEFTGPRWILHTKASDAEL